VCLKTRDGAPYGNDRYIARIILLGCVQIRSNALLLEIGGKDTYRDWVVETNKTFISKKCADNSLWLSPSRDDKHYGFNNYGVGLDVESGRVPELEFFKK
jgi:hypothetical protein